MEWRKEKVCSTFLSNFEKKLEFESLGAISTITAKPCLTNTRISLSAERKVGLPHFLTVIKEENKKNCRKSQKESDFSGYACEEGFELLTGNVWGRGFKHMNGFNSQKYLYMHRAHKSHQTQHHHYIYLVCEISCITFSKGVQMLVWMRAGAAAMNSALLTYNVTWTRNVDRRRKSSVISFFARKHNAWH